MAKSLSVLGALSLDQYHEASGGVLLTVLRRKEETEVQGGSPDGEWGRRDAGQVGQEGERSGLGWGLEE